MHDLDLALDRWFHRRGQVYAQDVPDLHYLAHSLCFGNRAGQAARVFELIGDLAASNPWSLVGDPAAAFGYWRDGATGPWRSPAERLVRRPIGCLIG
jgi:hypothetical protein